METYPQDYLWKLLDRLGIRRNRAIRHFDSFRDDSIDPSIFPDKLGLNQGDIVEVRSIHEVVSTLRGSRHKGLSFMPEMRKYCGNQFRVLKKVENYIIEGIDSKKIHPKNTVILEEVFCDGSWHGKCDRTCFCLWREKWLKKI